MDESGFPVGLKGLCVQHVRAGHDGMEVRVAATGARAPCPVCRRRSRSVHSAYPRTVADLPASGVRVTLIIVARRVRCRVGKCPRRISASACPG